MEGSKYARKCAERARLCKRYGISPSVPYPVIKHWIATGQVTIVKKESKESED